MRISVNPKRAGFDKTCTDGNPVRADRRLRTDDEAIRTQAAIFDEPACSF
jgi:hypothetical protein